MRKYLHLLGYSVYGVLLVGLIFHTSGNRVILNKYSVTYFVFLIAMLLIGASLRWIFRFFSEPSVLKGKAGKQILVRPLHKLIGYGALGLVCLFAVEHAYRLRHMDEISASQSQYHPYLQNILHTSGGGRINSHGFRGNAISKQKREGAVRIFMIGGSTVLSSGVPFEQCHSALLEQMLSESYPALDIEVQNAGNHWHATAHSMIKYLLDIKDYDPDVIILWHGINDLCRSFSPSLYAVPKYRSDYGHFYGAAARMALSYFDALRQPVRLQISFLSVRNAWQYLSDAFLSDFRSIDYSSPLTKMARDAKGTKVSTFSSLEAFERNLLSFADILASDHVTFVLATQPYLYKDNMSPAETKVCWFNREYCLEGSEYPDLKSMQRGMILFNDATRRVSKRTGVYLVELAKSIPQTMDYFRDDCHYTRKGNRAVALTLHDFIVDKDLLGDHESTGE